MKDASRFAMWQQPEAFNASVLDFSTANSCSIQAWCYVAALVLDQAESALGLIEGALRVARHTRRDIAPHVDSRPPLYVAMQHFHMTG